MSHENLSIEGLSSRDVFHIIIGLERLRDDNRRAAWRAARETHKPIVREAMEQYHVEGDAAEALRYRIKQTPGYDIDKT